MELTEYRELTSRLQSEANHHRVVAMYVENDKKSLEKDVHEITTQNDVLNKENNKLQLESNDQWNNMWAGEMVARQTADLTTREHALQIRDEKTSLSEELTNKVHLYYTNTSGLLTEFLSDKVTTLLDSISEINNNCVKRLPDSLDIPQTPLRSGQTDRLLSESSVLRQDLIDTDTDLYHKNAELRRLQRALRSCEIENEHLQVRINSLGESELSNLRSECDSKSTAIAKLEEKLQTSSCLVEMKENEVSQLVKSAAHDAEQLRLLTDEITPLRFLNNTTESLESEITSLKEQLSMISSSEYRLQTRVGMQGSYFNTSHTFL